MKLVTADDLRILEDTPKVLNPIFYERKELTNELKEIIKDAIYVNYPCFVIDWKSMRLRNSCFLSLEGISVAQVEGHVFETIQQIFRFIKNNKHQIVIHRLVIPNWINRPILSYAAKPGTKLICE